MLVKQMARFTCHLLSSFISYSSALNALRSMVDFSRKQRFFFSFFRIITFESLNASKVSLLHLIQHTCA